MLLTTAPSPAAEWDTFPRDGAPRDPLRAQRRGAHRLAVAGRWSARPDLHPRLGFARRGELALPRGGLVPPHAGAGLPAAGVRQARYRAVRSDAARLDDGGAHGRR